MPQQRPRFPWGREERCKARRARCLQSPPRPQWGPSQHWAVSRQGEENRLRPRAGSRVPRGRTTVEAVRLWHPESASFTGQLPAAHLTTACPSPASGLLNAPAHFPCREQPCSQTEGGQEPWVPIPAPLVRCVMEGAIGRPRISRGKQVTFVDAQGCCEHGVVLG